MFFEDTEQYIAFYDIYIRNAFGSYRDILKEVSFNRIMARWLSFEGNSSLQYNIENKGEASFPDENVSTKDNMNHELPRVSETLYSLILPYFCIVCKGNHAALQHRPVQAQHGWNESHG